MRYAYYLTGLLFILIANSTYAQKIEFNFNFDNAEQTLCLLKNKAPDDAAIHDFLQLKGTQALIRKIKAGEHLATEAIKEGAQGIFKAQAGDFQYSMISENLQAWEDFVHSIMARQDSIKTLLRHTLAPYLDKNKSYVFEVCFLMGGYSAGFTFGDSKTFYIGLHRYKFDLQGIVATCKHELFHNIQSFYYDASNTAEQLKKSGEGYAHAQSLLNYVFQEGTANYIEDYDALEDKYTPFLKEIRGHFAVNDKRIASLNLLFNNTLLNAFSKPADTNFETAYELLFDWQWNNPAYYIGEKMTKALVETKGKAVLLSYLKKDAVYFFSDYIALSKTSKEKYPIQFSDEFAAMIRNIKLKIESGG